DRPAAPDTSGPTDYADITDTAAIAAATAWVREPLTGAQDKTAAQPAPGAADTSLLDGFRPKSRQRERPASSAEAGTGIEAGIEAVAETETETGSGSSPGTGMRVRLTRGQLIAMGVGVAVTLAGVGWAVAAPSTAKPQASPSATMNPGRASAAASAVDDLAAQLKEAQGVAAEFAAPLAALQGASDEPARAAAETARQAFATALTAVVVPAKPSRTADAAALTTVEMSTSVAHDAIIAASTTFHAAISKFVGTMPGFAVQAVEDNSDASDDLQKVATSAAIKMAGSDPFTPPWFGPWDAWRAALAALIADANGSSGDRPSTGGGGTPDGADTPPAPSAPPADPAPSDPPSTDPPTDPAPTAPPTSP
ncbi:MAG: hypothetical protein JST25_06470, partial [Actinobacteria bacterium]|nr:hypothetical protein [Actinomycetota bacterium]